jgi:Calcineurin-like phosphoesterase
MNKILVLLILVFKYSLYSSASSIKSLGLVGDAGVNNPVISKLRTSLADHGVKDLVLLGDNIYDTNLSYDDIWMPWIKKGFNFPVVAIGNHKKSIEEEVSYFKLPADYYTIIFQSSRFIVLNSENLSNIDSQMSFLEKILTKRDLEKQVYLVVHHPYVTVSNFHSWTERPEFQKKLRSLILKYSDRITAVLSGHDHLATFVDVNGLPLIVSGASFEERPTRDLNYQDQKFRVREQWQYRGGKYWAKLDIAEAAQNAWVTFIPFEGGKIECRIRIYPKPYKKIGACEP